MHALDQLVEGFYPLLRNGLVSLRVYEEGELPGRRDHVIILVGEQMGCVGQVEGLTFLPRSNVVHSVSLREVWRPPALKYPMATEHTLESVAKLVPRVPTFTDTTAADNWLRDTRDLTVGDWVRWNLHVPTSRYVEVCHYEGKLIAIYDFDMPFWWEYRPRARGQFKVLRIDADGAPEITVVHEIMRV